MASLTESKFADGALVAKKDLRNALKALGEGWYTVPGTPPLDGSGFISADLTLVPSDFDGGVLLLEVDPNTGPVTITFPLLSAFPAGTRRILCRIHVINGNNPVTLSFPGNDVRSQPGTSGWNAATNPLKVGATDAGADEASVTVEAFNGRYKVEGAVRA